MGIGLRAVNGYSKEATSTNERLRYGADLICNMMFAEYVISVVI